MDLADRRLLHDVAHTLARPRREPADSFVLHASLELLARAGLWPHLRPDARAAARQRLRWLAAAYESAGDPVEQPRPVEPDPSRLVAALHAGDLDEVDAQATALAAVASVADLRRTLAGPLLTSLAAAAHGSILLHLLDRGAGLGLPLGLVRQALRETARQPTWQLRWFEDPGEPAVGAALSEVLLDVPRLGLPGSDFIHPLMSQAEDSGVAPRLLRGVATLDPVAAERELSRVAAWSMLQEPDEHVPYGWTHCLTMPQGAVRLADVAPHAVAVAATYVVGFRAAEGAGALDPAAPVEPALDPGTLAAYAAAHEDAHLAKYTLACFDAATRDPGQRHLYLAAATRLQRWWQHRDRDEATLAPCA